MPIKCLVSLLSYKVSSRYPLHLWYYSLILLQFLFILITISLCYIYALPNALGLGVISTLLVTFECFRATLGTGLLFLKNLQNKAKFRGVF